MSELRCHRLTRVPTGEPGSAWERLDAVDPLPPFVRADGLAAAIQQTTARIAHDGVTLFVRFDCVDRDIWGTYERRDDPLWQEEVVELFLAPGGEDPTRYYELEVSPGGVLFDARVENRGGDRMQRKVDVSWDCPGIGWSATADPARGRWRAQLSIPWASVAPPGAVPATWRANFYRVERPRDGEAEYSCWCPTLTEPADFHRPEKFGCLLW